MGQRNPIYSTQEFHDRWHSDETLESMSRWLCVSKVAIWKAARRRGFPGKFEVRAES